MGGTEIAIAGVIATLAGSAANAIAQNNAAKKSAAAQREAAQMQQEQSDRDFSRQTAQMRQANQTQPDISALLDQNTSGGTGGASLTGASGAQAGAGNLRGPSLLGG